MQGALFCPAVRLPDIIPGQVDVLPAERRQVSDRGTRVDELTPHSLTCKFFRSEE